MSGRDLSEGRLCRRANLHYPVAPGVKAAARRRVERGRHIAFQQNHAPAGRP